MKSSFLIISFFISTLCYAQVEGEMELGGGLYSWAFTDGLFDEGQLGGVQAQFDYDFLKGPLRAAIGVKAIAVVGYTYLQPGVKLGRDIINLNISVELNGLTYYGLSSRIGFGPDKQHAINLSVQGAAENLSVQGAADLTYGYGSTFIGYSYRF